MVLFGTNLVSNISSEHQSAKKGRKLNAQSEFFGANTVQIYSYLKTNVNDNSKTKQQFIDTKMHRTI